MCLFDLGRLGRVCVLSFVSLSVVPMNRIAEPLQWTLLHSGDAMSRAAIDSALEAMEAANKVMHREGRVHLI